MEAYRSRVPLTPPGTATGYMSICAFRSNHHLATMSSELGHHMTASQSHSPIQQAQPDLRHVTSTSFRSPKRASQMHKTSEARLGSRSPGSIPSSPTSVHSSSSAIFERDIEPVAPPSPPVSSNPHRIPRAKTTEHLDQSVPSVLDSAAEILTRWEDPEGGDQIAVVTPAATSFTEHAGRSSGFTSPIGSFRSRSPSPLGLRLSPGASAGQRADLLLSIPQPIQHQPHVQPIPVFATSSPQSNTSSSGVPSYPTIQTNFGHETVRVNAPPSIVTPTSAYFTSASSTADDESSPTATSHDDHEAIKAGTVHPATATATTVGSSPLHTFSTYSANTSHPPSPTHAATKRLSFMSYSDLLTSAPASTYPLSMLTTSASTVDPPPHLLSVSGLTQGPPNPGSATGSLRGFVMNGGRVCKRDSMFDDAGGEWEREGFGKGLEERLEALMPATSPVVGQKA